MTDFTEFITELAWFVSLNPRPVIVCNANFFLFSSFFFQSYFIYIPFFTFFLATWKMFALWLMAFLSLSPSPSAPETLMALVMSVMVMWASVCVCVCVYVSFYSLNIKTFLHSFCVHRNKMTITLTLTFWIWSSDRIWMSGLFPELSPQHFFSAVYSPSSSFSPTLNSKHNLANVLLLIKI